MDGIDRQETDVKTVLPGGKKNERRITGIEPVFPE